MGDKKGKKICHLFANVFCPKKKHNKEMENNLKQS